MTAWGIWAHEGRHVHTCARCGDKLTVKGADFRVRQPVRTDGTLGELIVQLFTCPAPAADCRTSGPAGMTDREVAAHLLAFADRVERRWPDANAGVARHAARRIVEFALWHEDEDAAGNRCPGCGGPIEQPANGRPRRFRHDCRPPLAEKVQKVHREIERAGGPAR